MNNHHHCHCCNPVASLSLAEGLLVGSPGMCALLCSRASALWRQRRLPIRRLASASVESAAGFNLKNAIDFRSDTVTIPTEAMRRAMGECPVGDDVMREDPTVNKLEAMGAEMLGKEAAVFVPTGTMGNLLALMTHCSGRSNELIVGDQQHIFLWEQGGSASLAGVHPRSLPNQPDGTLDLNQIEAAVRSVDSHYPRTKLVCLENTHNRTGGRVLAPQYIAKVKAICDKHGLKLHIDGARIWNAAVALKTEVKDLVKHADSVSVCLSKGIGAPAGTLLVGTREFVETYHLTENLSAKPDICAKGLEEV
eukprot:TRINITY_DN7376_c0_g1_i2.p1 TRINITY_DN7376_c0_g1~~TRINITY_DN7376_c0_g1_i2.p1  ORF type:complete len:318 (-),score=67.74 TRINITY_DN7376_c0_g1_i2:424-1347(-)